MQVVLSSDKNLISMFLSSLVTLEHFTGIISSIKKEKVADIANLCTAVDRTFANIQQQNPLLLERDFYKHDGFVLTKAFTERSFTSCIRI